MCSPLQPFIGRLRHYSPRLRLDRRFSYSWSEVEAEICRIAMRNVVSASGMLDARKRGLGGRGGRRQAVSAAFIALSNRALPKSDGPWELGAKRVACLYKTCRTYQLFD